MCAPCVTPTFTCIQTDSLIQKTIRKAFSDRTTVTIAHRLDTIIFSDRILAMAAGQLKEFETPTTLLQNSASFFTKLVGRNGDGYQGWQEDSRLFAAL